MATHDKIKVYGEQRVHPNLRKLARALIVLARAQLEENGVCPRAPGDGGPSPRRRRGAS